ncbi:MAG: hypothetical protein AABM66_09325 [Actinomycetota bacterium]
MFTSGYLVVWSAAGVVAYGLDGLARRPPADGRNRERALRWGIVILGTAVALVLLVR